MANADYDTPSDFTDALFVVGSFLDGEAVDPHALRDALARPEARDYLVEVLTIREAVFATAPHAWAGDKKVGPRRRLRWLATAAGVVLSLAASYLAGQETARAQPVSSNIETVMSATAPALPEPTRVIALRPGVNWTETTGGH